MTRHMILMAACGATMLASTTAVEADILEIRADISRSVTFLDPNGPEAAAGFQLGESVTLEFTFDSSITDSIANPARAEYRDPAATYRLIGNSSGAVLEYSPGLRIGLASDERIDIRSLANPANALNTPVLSGFMVWENNPANQIFTDVNDLSSVLADLFATSFEAPRNPIATTTFWDGSASVAGMRMAGPPVGAAFTLLNTDSHASCPGDTNGDGQVNTGDLLTLLASFGMSTTNGAADGDFDGSGDVNTGDLLTLLAVFGTDC